MIRRPSILRAAGLVSLATMVSRVLGLLREITIAYLFGGEATPTCLDACDGNDSGSVDIGDAIYLLGFLFAGGAVPAFPFPDHGIDPVDDALGPCRCP